MSTRKSINKQQNSDAVISSSQDTTPTLRSKQQQNQDAGSESSEAPSTPTSKDSNQSNTTETKRKRRTNSTQSISTPKRSTSEAADLSANESEKSMIKDIKEEKSTTPQSESPRTRKKTIKGNITLAKRKSASAEAALKIPPVRSSLRAKNNSIKAKKNASPNDSFGTPKRRSRARKKTEAIFTPIKRERSTSNQSENEQDDEIPDTKRIKIEKVEDGVSDEEILMDIRTEILNEIRAKEEELIEVKDEKPDSELSVSETKFGAEIINKSQPCVITPEKHEKKSSNDDSKDDVSILLTPNKEVSDIDDEEDENINKDRDDNKKNEQDSIEMKNVDDDVVESDAEEKPSDDSKNNDEGSKQKEDSPLKPGTKRPRRKAAVIASPQSKKLGRRKKEVLPVQTTRRGRTPRAAATAALTKTMPSLLKKTNKATDITNLKPSIKSPVPENTEESETTKTQVPESIEDDDISNSEPTELIFSTTGPGNRDNFDQPHEPLMIDTSTQNSDGKDSIPSTECTAGSEKSASLSPVELESEGVSAVSVKQFYKEPQFLENNLGIEMDPKLGGIVQTVDKEPTQDNNVDTSIVNTKIDEKCSQADVDAIDVKEEKIAGNDIEDKKIDFVAETMPSDASTTRNSKIPEHADDANDESDLSDSIKEGELMLVLEDSTEEENTLSQKSNNREPQPEDSNANEKREEDSSPKLKDTETNGTIIEIKSVKEIIEDKKEIILHDNISEEDQEKDSKQNLNHKAENACESKAALKTGGRISTDQEKEEKEIEKYQVLRMNVTSENIQSAEDDMEKDVIENESMAMEIDSGVSDVAENNSNDPNEDINSITELIACEHQKEEISDSENAVNTVLPSVSVNKRVNPAKAKEKKSLATPIKFLTPKDEKKDIPPHIIKVNETPETLKQKENHLKSLGLLTIKAADEAKIEKQKRRQQLNVSTPSTSKNVNGNASNASDSSSGTCSSNGNESNAGNGNGNGSASSSNESGNNKTVQEYTGTLKTVIKLNRPTGTPIQSSDKKKTNGNSNSQNSVSANSMALVPVTSNAASGRMPLKITLQKGRGRGTHMERHANGTQNSNEDTYYTIQNESEAGVQETVTHDQNAVVETVATDKKEVLIPEKASSFAIHPGRLCQDQCFYCGGKFGLYDTPCHVAQLKSAERQKKILENEEKLTVDNCLCDACFRHLDRRANAAAAQKKRLSAPSNNESQTGENAEGCANESTEGGNETLPVQSGNSIAKSTCFVTNCEQRASHSFRRKGFRKTIKKLLGDDIDLTNMSGRLPICDKHYEIIIQCLECALCKRRLIRNHMHHITQDVQLLESLLVKQGIPVKLQANPAVCKLCRYFTNLLLKPPEGKTQKAQFVKNYRKRLLHFHNVQQSDEGSEAEEQDETAEKAKSQVTAPAKRGRKPKKPQPATETENQTQSNPATSEDGSSNEIVDLDADTTPQPTATGSGQMQLDNDVMVDYDLPVICDTPSPPAEPKPLQPQQSKLQAILQGASIARNNDDISLALRSNPNISMRELFPGEEDLGLQVNVPFGSSTAQRTPEGWTRIQTFLQYDEPTRRLWEDLQKPYGNQSSFLRHLILLEKYFRNGDLILSQNASTNAIAYSETVQNRLHSFDCCVPPPSAKPSNNNITALSSTTCSSAIMSITQQPPQQQQPQQQQQKNQINPSFKTTNSGSANGNIGHNKIVGNNPRNTGMLSVPDPIKKLHSNLTITITPKTKLIAETTQACTPSTATSTPTTTAASHAGSSILKTNLLSRKNSAIEIIPISAGPNSSEMSARPVMTPLTKQQKILAAANQLMGEEKTSTTANLPITSLPITNAQNQPKHLNFPPELISINRSNSNSLLIGNRNLIGNNTSIKSKTHSNMHPQPHLQQSSHRPIRLSPTVIKLPATLSAHERMNSKHWRPTLMPINSGPVRSAPGILYQTADGRRLPSLVQVQSGGKPYLISIQDYNRMCILRREKLLRDQMIKNGKVGGSGGASSSSSSGHSLLKGALSSNSGIHISTANSPSISNVVSLSNSAAKTTLLSQGGKQW